MMDSVVGVGLAVLGVSLPVIGYYWGRSDGVKLGFNARSETELGKKVVTALPTDEGHWKEPGQQELKVGLVVFGQNCMLEYRTDKYSEDKPWCVTRYSDFEYVSFARKADAERFTQVLEPGNCALHGGGRK